MFRKKQEQKPTHWQLPTYDGTKSYHNLLVGVYGGINTGWGNWTGSHMDAILHNSAISLIRNGYYYYSSGDIINPGSYGNYWASSSSSITDAGYLNFRSTDLYSLRYGFKSYGIPIRCPVR